MRKFIATILLLAGCDPCDAAARVHLARCADGVAESCTWLQDHGALAGPMCTTTPPAG